MIGDSRKTILCYFSLLGGSIDMHSIFFERGYDFVQNTPNNKLNYRYIETSIIKRVMQIDNRKTDYLFGISNTRIQHIVNIERDFVEQFYAFGIIGSIILLFIYPLSLFLLIKNYLKKRSYFNLLLIINCLIFIFVSYLTGNILNSITTTIPYAVLTNHNILQNKTKKCIKYAKNKYKM